MDNWDDLRFALEAAREGSFSGAARAMGVAVTTVSRRIDALEARLDVRLFNRTYEGLELTESGAQLVERMHSIEDRVLALEREAMGHTDEVAGVVRISTIEPVAADIIAPHLGELLDAHPELEVILLSEQSAVNLARREADIAVRVGKPRGADLLIRRLTSFRFGLFASHSYLDRHGAPDSPETSLAGHRIVTYDDRFHHLPEVAWLHVRAQEATFALRTPSTRVMVQAVKHGLGVGVLPLAAASEELVCLLGPEHFPERPLWLVLHPDTAQVARIRATADFLVRTLQRLAPALAPEAALRHTSDAPMDP